MTGKKKNKKKVQNPVKKTEEQIIKEEEDLIKKIEVDVNVTENNSEENTEENRPEVKRKEKMQKTEKKEEEKKKIEPELKLTLDVPASEKEDKENIEDNKYYTFNPTTKIYKCKTCEKVYKRQGSCITHIKKIHYKDKDIKIDKKKGSAYVPIMSYKEFKKDGRQIAVIIMNFLTYNVPIWIKLFMNRKLTKKLSKEKQYKLTVFAGNLGSENIKNLENSFHHWGKDFYSLLCDLKIFNLIFKIKYLALITVFVGRAKGNYSDYAAFLDPQINQYKDNIETTGGNLEVIE